MEGRFEYRKILTNFAFFKIKFPNDKCLPFDFNCFEDPAV